MQRSTRATHCASCAGTSLLSLPCFASSAVPGVLALGSGLPVLAWYSSRGSGSSGTGGLGSVNPVLGGRRNRGRLYEGMTGCEKT